jgi:GTP-binding protein
VPGGGSVLRAAGKWGRPAVVAIVGRPNVGKSTLANRFVGRRIAIVEKSPGVTRDRNVLSTEWRGVPIEVVDTGGWLPGGTEALARKVSLQAERAVRQADLALLVIDAVVGVTDEDEAAAAMLRRAEVPVVLAANKVDSASREAEAWRAARLGLGDPWMVSALHGRGTADLLDEIVTRLRAAPDPSTGERPLEAHATSGEAAGGSGGGGEAGVQAVSIVGRPNTGKSTLFNRLVGDERAVTHEVPGTTRDAIDTVVTTDAGTFRFIDTAGMRRRSRIGESAEYYSLVRTLRAIDQADVALLMIDAADGVTLQDQRLGERLDAAGSPVVILLNKWEMLDEERKARVAADAEDRFAFLSYAPVLKVSALTGLGVHRILPAVRRSIEAYQRRVPTSEVNRVVQTAQASHPAPSARVLYAVQGAVDPPTFTLFTSRPLPKPYLRYLERRLREELGFGPTPLKLRVRRRSEG